MATTPSKLPVPEIQPSPSQFSLSSFQLTSSPAGPETTGSPTTLSPNTPLTSTAEPLRKPILCCDKLLIVGKEPFNPFGHPERKLHYLCSHWSGKMAEVDIHEHNKYIGLDPYSFWGAISVIEFDDAADTKSIRWYAPYANTTSLGGRNGLGDTDGKFMEITHGKAITMIRKGLLVEGKYSAKYTGCPEHPKKRYKAQWYGIPVEAKEN